MLNIPRLSSQLTGITSSSSDTAIGLPIKLPGNNYEKEENVRKPLIRRLRAFMLYVLISEGEF